jgi:tetratricopeptide (TPR) repeat protein
LPADKNQAALVQALQRKDYAGALRLVDQSIARNPRDPKLQFQRGQLLQHLGRDEASLQAFDAALALAPQQAAVHHSRGIALKRLGRLEEAVAAYDRAIALLPDQFQMHHNRGVALRLLRRYAEAEAALRKALALNANSPDTLNSLGGSLQGLGRQKEALAVFEQALQLRPGHAEYLNNRGLALSELHRHEEAMAVLEEALRAEPDSSRTLMNLGVVHYRQLHFKQALDLFDRAARLAPDDLDIRFNRATVLCDVERFEEGLAELSQLAQARPNDPEVRMNLANALRDTGQDDAADAAYRRALEMVPEHAGLHWNFALALLTAGRWSEGWREYEWRWRAEKLRMHEVRLPKPKWLGETSPAGKTLLLHAEQGLGDTLMACRFVPAIAALGARVVLVVPKPLVAVLRTLDGVAKLIPQGEDLGAYDLHCPLMSLPLALGITLDNLPAEPYLHADAALVERWKPVLRGQPQLQIGLAWSGNPDNPMDYRRSLPLARMLDVLPQGPRYWCLQKDVSADDAALMAGRVERFEQNDFANTAAQATLLDAVVTIDTSIVHLCGALGVRTLMPLPVPADFRWLRRGDTPWYPSVRVFRQSAPHQWDEPLAAVGRELDRMVASHAPAQP